MTAGGTGETSKMAQLQLGDLTKKNFGKNKPQTFRAQLFVSSRQVKDQTHSQASATQIPRGKSQQNKNYRPDAPLCTFAGSGGCETSRTAMRQLSTWALTITGVWKRGGSPMGRGGRGGAQTACYGREQYVPPDQGRCFRCGQPGHRQTLSRKYLDRAVHWCFSIKEAQRSQGGEGWYQSSTRHPKEEPTIPVTINERQHKFMEDTGAK